MKILVLCENMAHAKVHIQEFWEQNAVKIKSVNRARGVVQMQDDTEVSFFPATEIERLRGLRFDMLMVEGRPHQEAVEIATRSLV